MLLKVPWKKRTKNGVRRDLELREFKGFTWFPSEPRTFFFMKGPSVCEMSTYCCLVRRQTDSKFERLTATPEEA